MKQVVQPAVKLLSVEQAAVVELVTLYVQKLSRMHDPSTLLSSNGIRSSVSRVGNRLQ